MLTPGLVGKDNLLLADGVEVLENGQAERYFLRADGVTWRKAGQRRRLPRQGAAAGRQLRGRVRVRGAGLAARRATCAPTHSGRTWCAASSRSPPVSRRICHRSRSARSSIPPRPRARGGRATTCSCSPTRFRCCSARQAARDLLSARQRLDVARAVRYHQRRGLADPRRHEPGPDPARQRRRRVPRSAAVRAVRRGGGHPGGGQVMNREHDVRYPTDTRAIHDSRPDPTPVQRACSRFRPDPDSRSRPDPPR